MYLRHFCLVTLKPIRYVGALKHTTLFVYVEFTMGTTGKISEYTGPRCFDYAYR